MEVAGQSASLLTVNSVDIADGTIVTADLADAAVTSAKLAASINITSLTIGGGTAITGHLSAASALDAAAPAAVPGCSADLTIAVAGVAMGDTVTIGTPVTMPASFMLNAWVSAAGTVSVRWCQLAGAAADPDGAGGTYRADAWKH